MRLAVGPFGEQLLPGTRRVGYGAGAEAQQQGEDDARRFHGRPGSAAGNASSPTSSRFSSAADLPVRRDPSGAGFARETRRRRRSGCPETRTTKRASLVVTVRALSEPGAAGSSYSYRRRVGSGIATSARIVFEAERVSTSRSPGCRSARGSGLQRPGTVRTFSTETAPSLPMKIDENRVTVSPRSPGGAAGAPSPGPAAAISARNQAGYGRQLGCANSHACRIPRTGSGYKARVAFPPWPHLARCGHPLRWGGTWRERGVPRGGPAGGRGGRDCRWAEGMGCGRVRPGRD